MGGVSAYFGCMRGKSGAVGIVVGQEIILELTIHEYQKTGNLQGNINK